ncbi:uncharacterized protein PFLUO_LOCUS9415 [Penicillium psychrofluorescens]|uniref:uncharacterized protein n=1 Tax=Penicillium psychrofluorescens TaxID=3158075 RepID=UPI003CCE1F46
MPNLNNVLETLAENYSACDVSDALLKIQHVPEGSTVRAGYLADLVPFSPLVGRNATVPRVAAPATTFKFVAKASTVPPLTIATNENHSFPPGKHWVDYAGDYEATHSPGVGSIVVIEQPEGQYCAVTGGIMATRMKFLGIKAAVIGGRVRDLKELSGTGLPVWARGTSTVGTNAEAKPAARNVPISIGGLTVSPGDIVFCDPLEGVVVIPRELLGPVMEIMPRLTRMDEKAKQAVAQGMSVTEAFTTFRSPL